ncbi:MAG: hypothetical protein CMH56_03770 [Myxococcales bacterium]|nr:hypothetical protein [Myxococcales bacterium]|tara:strand:- start:1859 stop:3421 length:1563 start_codon:yes stop_codon:yes gene_type:complete
MKKPGLFILGLAAFAFALPQNLYAFCGFYVAGGDASLFNNATQVVLMRHDNRTVLSMQNNYDGPTDDFAMVVPVPVVLQEANVQTLDAELFNKIDQLSAPRLVEYWERDPCNPWMDMLEDGAVNAAGGEPPNTDDVTVEAEFQVGEYDIVILSANDASSLETWLTSNQYNIPTGAAEHFTPYIEAGEYFFVAKVDATKVTFEDGKAVLSPLRFYYDSETFSLPVKLGLINSQGTQDIIVYILAVDQRYEVANYDNVFIPTNLAVTEDVKENFGPFYTSLFAETINQAPNSVVTEYSWNASTCDPCPGPTLDATDYATLGADVAGAPENSRNWVLTRLHARYEADGLGQDLVFQTADPIVGGRQMYTWDGEERGDLEQGAQPGNVNNFQGRYIIYHPWDGELTCDEGQEPVYGEWGGPDGDEASGTAGSAMSPNSTGEDVPQSNSDNHVTELSSWLVNDLPELNIVANGGNAGNNAVGGTNIEPGQQSQACACRESGSQTTTGLWGLALLFMGLLGFKRRD